MVPAPQLRHWGRFKCERPCPGSWQNVYLVWFRIDIGIHFGSPGGKMCRLKLCFPCPWLVWTWQMLHAQEDESVLCFKDVSCWCFLILQHFFCLFCICIEKFVASLLRCCLYMYIFCRFLFWLVVFFKETLSPAASFVSHVLPICF